MMSEETGALFRGLGEKGSRTKRALALATVVLLGGACKQSEEPAASASDPVTQEAAEATTGDLTPQEQALQTVLERYEEIRERLAADEASLGEAPSALAEAATAAHGTAAEGWHENLDEVASKAEALGAADGGMAERRELFGEISRELVTVLAGAPNVAARWNVFECPMASGYSKWIQKGAGMANPYMGKKMLECGTATDWTP